MKPIKLEVTDAELRDLYIERDKASAKPAKIARDVFRRLMLDHSRLLTRVMEC